MSHIAVAHFEPPVASRLAALFESAGHSIAAPPEVNRPVSSPAGPTPDLIVSGLEVPKLDGWRLCRDVRRPGNRYLDETPVLLLSATLAGPEARRVTLDSGGDELLPLSITDPQLLDAVGRLISTGRAHSDSNDSDPIGFEQRYRTLFTQMLDGCAIHEMIFDSDGQPADYRFLAINPAFERITGLAADRILGRTVLEVLPGTETHWIQSYGRVVLTGEPFTFENYHPGLRKHFEVLAFRPQEGQFACVFREITERVQREREIRGLIRLHAALSQINQTVVRAATRQQLFSDICKVTSEFGHFLWSWIGLKDPVTDQLTLMAESTFDVDFPHPIAPGQCDMVREALSEDRPATRNISSEDPSGMQSCAAFPIHCHQRVCGVLCLHSDEPEFFNSKKINLLEEAALDISFALDKFEAEAERERALQESEAKFSLVFRSAPVMMAITEIADGTVVDVNDKLLTSLGWAPEEITGKSTVEAGVLTAENRTRILEAILRDGHTLGQPVSIRGKSGRQVEGEYSGTRVTIDGRDCLLSVLTDITERKEHELERETMLRLLRVINSANDIRSLIQDVTCLLQVWSGCDSIGVRLGDGEDFPYFETRGFPARFVLAESRLCVDNSDGALLCDSEGNPALECMCGNVLCGRFDPLRPFFTANGSFWTNSTSELPASTTEAERQARTRNRCDGEGYESVALIPIRYAGRTLGLLQCNDRRRGRFTPAKINLLERAAASLAIALEQRRTQESLSASREHYRLVADYTYDWEFWLGPDGHPLYHSPSCERITGYTAAEFLSDPDLQASIIHPDDLETYRCHSHEDHGDRELKKIEFRIRTRSGADATIEHICQPVHGEDGRYLGRRGSNRDITGRKQAGEALRASEARFAAFMSNLPAAAFVKDEAGRTLFANPYLQELFGFQNCEGQPTRRLVEGAAGLRMEEDDRKALAQGPLKTQETVTDCHGATRTFETIKFPIGVEGNAALLGGVSIDITERERAAEALRNSEYWLRESQRASRIGSYVLDIQSGLWTSSETLDEIFGIGTDYVRNVEGWGELVHPEHRTEMTDYFQNQVIGQGRPFNHEYKIQRHCDGNVAWVLGRGILTQNADGKPVRMVGTIQDVTERKRGEQAVIDRERYLAAILQTTADGFWVVDSNGRILEANCACQRMTGYTREELLTLRVHDLVAGHPGADVAARLRRIVLNGSDLLETRHRRKDGSTYDVEVSTTYLDTEGGRFVSFFRDITDRKRAEVELAQTNLRLQLAAASGGLGIWEWDIPSNTLVWDDRMFELYGIAPSQFSGCYEAWQAGLHPDDRARNIQAIQAAVEGQQQYDLEFRVVHPSGAVRHIKADALVVRDADGCAVRMIGLNRDVTEGKLAAEERERLQVQLTQAQKMESIGRLAGGVAHDFNNLLTVINGYSDMVLRQLQPDDPRWKYVNEIGRAGDRAAGLTRQLLAFSRKQITAPVAVDLNHLISENQAMLKRLIGEDVEISLELGSKVGRVLADPDQLHQVLMNLAVNARDAMPAGGQLSLKTESIFLDEAFSSTHMAAPPGFYAVLSVSDTGIGMDEKVLQHLFEPFFTTKEKGKGTGLGLSTVYGIVRQCGGWIDVESELRKGTTFRVVLPRMAGSPETQPRDSLLQESLKGSETILVVEDQEEVRQFAVEVLRSFGYRVLEAGNGGDAVSVAERHFGPIHLLLSDVVMPGLSGQELADRLKGLRPSIAVLLMSGYPGDTGARGEGTEELAYLPKPFTPEILAARVREVLGPPRPLGRVLVLDD